MNKDITIKHGIFYPFGEDGIQILDKKNGIYIPICLKLRRFLFKMFEKFEKPLEFTYGLDPDNSIECLALCHPTEDGYDQKGEGIVKNRIKEFRKVSEEIINKYPWIYKLEANL